MEPAPSSTGNVNALDVLDRVLEKGLVIAGDIRISLLNVELLTIRIRLLMCAIEKAEQLGLDWWNYDRYLRPRALPRARKPAGRIVAPSPRAQYDREPCCGRQQDAATRPQPVTGRRIQGVLSWR